MRGIRDNDIRERLLQQAASETYNDAVKLSLAIESSKLESKKMVDQHRLVNQIKNNAKIKNQRFKRITVSRFDKIKRKRYKRQN